MRRLFLFLLIFIVVCSCSFGGSDKHEIIIESFQPNSDLIDTIIPKKGRGYFNHSVRIQGFVDDSIWFSVVPNGNKFYLCKKVDKKINSDYYGGTEAYLRICHYKAKEGHLKIIHSISY